MNTEKVNSLLKRGRIINARIGRNVARLAHVQRELATARRKAARRDGELLRTIREAKRDGQTGNHPAVPKEERDRELAILVTTDTERTEIEAEVGRLTIERERFAGALETNRNELKLIMLELRDLTRGAGDTDYQPDAV